MKTHSITTVVLISIMSILGCGGEEESKTAEVAAPTETTTLPPVDNTVLETMLTGDLISAPDFNLISSAKLQISLPASPSTTISYFINICTDFSSLNSSANDDYNDITINYGSCKLRTKITSTAQQVTLSLSATEEQLIAQIWPIENGAQPINIYWNIADSGKNWAIEF